jgi:16S rRNA C967 or C1407 C5-methylase (RsmB/RsmF family)
MEGGDKKERSKHEEEEAEYRVDDLVPNSSTIDNTLLQFLEHNRLPLNAYDLPALYRFIRINPRNPIELEALKSQLNCEVEGVHWLSNYSFYRLPHGAKIASIEAYKKGQIYGMDASSAAAVVALGVKPTDHVLDLCCAPGAKLCMIGDIVGEHGSVTGVDVSEDRLGACRNVVAKYNLYNVRLVLDDATKVQILAPPTQEELLNARADSTEPNDNLSITHKNETNDTRSDNLPRSENETQPQENSKSPSTPSNPPNPTNNNNKKSKKKKYKGGAFQLGSRKRETGELVACRWRKRKKRRRVAGDELPNIFYAHPHYLCLKPSSKNLYNKVLVDAQCTLDASVRHILKYKKLGWKTFHVDINAQTVALQKQMILNGFRLLAPGGTLVYSTCSFCKEQNEEVVEWLLIQESGRAQLAPIEGAEEMPCSAGLLAHTLRFYPAQTGTSGLFIAKIIKTQNETSSSGI